MSCMHFPIFHRFTLKKAGIIPKFISKDKLYCKAHNAISHSAFYLVNTLSQFYKTPLEIDYTTHRNFGEELETSPLFPLKVETIPNDVSKKLTDILQVAFQNKSSDIHFIPGPKTISVFFRMNGRLFPTLLLKDTLGLAVINLIKLKAQLNMTKAFQPQNGQFTFITSQFEVYCRASTLPCLHGESLVLRLLSPQLSQTHRYDTLNTIAFTQNFVRCLPGLWLISGPIGHGKTTTYYHLLNQIKSKRIISFEDPIEVPQSQMVQLNLDNSLTADAFMRNLLRQSVDVVGIGEIRTPEQLKLAVNAALTGHCVIATFHAGTRKDVYLRLENLGYTPLLQQQFLKGVLFQKWDNAESRSLLFEC
jgi:type II secretory ATPase GspE/PulE/Tfp pilus assembly ATPase PilB-like protein